jgi:hypothetical protein
MFRRPHTETLSIYARHLMVAFVVHACNVPSCSCFRLLSMESFKAFSEETTGMSYSQAKRSLAELEAAGWVHIIKSPGKGRWGSMTLEIPKLRNTEQMLRAGLRPQDQKALTEPLPQDQKALTEPLPDQKALTEPQKALTEPQKALTEPQKALTEPIDWGKVARGKGLGSPQKQKQKKKKSGE